MIFVNETVKLLGSLAFNLSPLEANLKRLDMIVKHMSAAGDRLEGRFKKMDLAIDNKGLAVQKENVNFKYKEAKAHEAIASTRLKEAMAGKISLQQASQQALIQNRLTKTKVLEADLQNKLADAESRRLNIAAKRLQLEQKMRQLEMGIVPVGAGGGGDGYTFGAALEHRFGWFASSMAFFGSGMVFGNILEQMGKVEMDMIKIQRVTEDATASFSLMRDELFKLAKDYGINMATVQDIALRWAQAGYNVRDTLELTRVSLLALNTAELDATQSTQALIGIMTQWSLKAKDMQLVVDKINKTADDYAVSSQDLVDGLLRSSGAARVMGMSFDQLLGVLTATREASGRTGREVGNAINSILSYMQRPKAIETFEGLGIKVFANEARTEFRNVIEIMGDLSSKWEDASDQIKDGFVQAADEVGLFNEDVAIALDAQERWTDLQKRDLSQAAAGVYRRNYLIALLRNFAQIQGVVNNLHDAEGYSLRENARTMEAYVKKVEALNAALTELAVVIGDAGLLNVMKGLADGTREAIEVFTSLPPAARNAIILFTELTLAIGFANLALRTFTGAGFGYMLTQLAARIAGVSAATMGLGAALTTLATHPVVITIAAVGAAVVAINQYQKSQERATQEAMDAAIKAQDHAKSVTELANKYRRLTGDVEAGKDVQKELTGVMNDLAQVFPGVVTQWDAQGNAIAINNDLLQENIQLAREAVRENARVGLVKAQKKIARAQEEIDRLQLRSAYGLDMGIYDKEIRDLNNEIREASAAMDRFNAILDGDGGDGMIGVGLIPRKGTSKNESATTTEGPSGGNEKGIATPGSVDVRAPGFADPLRESANVARLAIDPLNDALQLTETLIQGVEIRGQILEMAIKNQKIPSLEHARAKYALLSDAISLNERKQTELHMAANEARAQLAPLKEKLEGLTKQHESNALSAQQFNAAVSALRPVINALEKDIAQYGNQWWQAKQAIAAAEDAQADMVRTLIRSTREIQRENALDALAKAQESALSAMERQGEEALDNLERAQEAHIRSLESFRDAELESLKGMKDAYEEASNAKIRAIQAEIDALELENDLLDEQEELLFRQRAVEEARTKIANIEADKKIRVVGTDGQWTYIADEVALQDARRSLEDAEKELAGTQADIRKNARRRELDSKIEYEQNIQKIQLDSYGRQVEAARKAWNERLAVEKDAQQKERDQQQQAWNRRLNDFRAAQANEKTALEAHWNGMLNAERINHDAMNEIIQNGLMGPNGALAKWRDYYDQVESLQRSQMLSPGTSSWGVAPGGGGIPGPVQSGIDNARIGADGLTDYTRAVRNSLLRAGAVVAPLSLDTGGPVLYDQMAKIHGGEYMLNAQTVRALGGFAGVEKLVAMVNAPGLAGMFSGAAARIVQPAPGTYHNVSPSVDRRVQILGNINIPHVYDVSGFIRNLEQYSVAG